MSVAKTVDFALFLHGTDSERSAAAAALVDSFRQCGFVKLINHGMSGGMIEDAEGWVRGLHLKILADSNTDEVLLGQNRAFFELGPAEKAEVLNVPSPNPQRGWSYKGAESTARLKNTGNVKLTDEKEHFDMGPVDDKLFPNKWTESTLPGFRAFSETFYVACQSLCLQIMSAFELACSLPVDTLVERCKPAASELRYNHYPSVTLGRLMEGTTRRGWPHTDFGLITLLFQDTIGGLQYEDRSTSGGGSFIHLAREDAHEIAVNISDTFQRWTNDSIRAGVHQVWLPPRLHEEIVPKPEERQPDWQDIVIPERKSTVFFFKAHRDVCVGALDQFCDEKNPSRYEDITALQFHQKMTDVLIRGAAAVPI